LPFYYFLASTYAMNDRHFASARSGTYPDRNFLLFGTANGVTCTGCGYPAKNLPSIFSELTAAGVSWAAYTDGDYFSGTLGTPESYFDASHLRGGVSTGNKQFFADLASADFPSVVFVDGDDNVTDEHPTADLQRGESWSRDIYEAVLASPHWNDMALLWTYDEGGGFFDHVPPPPNDAAATMVCLDGDPKDGTKFDELGVRVPMAVISPYARPHYVSHVIQEHTAITRFLEVVFDLPALTNRDANSDALLDMFDFDCGPSLLVPPDAPAPGANGCGANTVHLTTDKPVYASGDPILVTFTNGPGNDDLDWIAIYNYGDTPHSGSLVWVRSDGERTNTPKPCPAGCPVTNTVTLTNGDQNGSNWPLPSGQYIV
jgi:phospholipase C